MENTYEIIEEEAETVRMIYDLYLTGLGGKAIASKLIASRRKKQEEDIIGKLLMCIEYWIIRLMQDI